MTIIMRMWRTDAGMHYTVVVDGRTVWSKVICWGPRSGRWRVKAAREQEAVAMRWSRLYSAP